MITEPLDQLRGDLVGAIEQRRRRVRRRRTALTSGALVALPTIALVVLFGLSTGDQALAISRGSNWIELRIQDATADPEEMNAELRDASVSAVVQLVPAPPDRVGTWIAARSNGAAVGLIGDSHADKERVEKHTQQAGVLQVQIQPEVVRLPSSFKGQVILIAGRAANPGEAIGEAPDSDRR